MSRESGYPNALIEIVNGNEFRLDASGEAVIEHLPPGSWAVEATPGFWSKFIVLLPSNPWGARLAADDPRIELIRRLIRRWKSVFSSCGGLVVIEAGRAWGYPRWTWGRRRVRWGGNDVSLYAVD